MKMVKFIFKMAAISGIERHKMTVCAHTCTVDWSVQLCTEHHRNMQRKGRETEGVVAPLMQVVHSGPFGLQRGGSSWPRSGVIAVLSVLLLSAAGPWFNYSHQTELGKVGSGLCALKVPIRFLF